MPNSPSIVGLAPGAHAAEFRFDDAPTLLCRYPPSQQNAFTGRLTQDMLQAVLRRAREPVRDGV